MMIGIQMDHGFSGCLAGGEEGSDMWQSDYEGKRPLDQRFQASTVTIKMSGR
jgi:hypothetical protein